jgi:RNA polymerase sigma factor (sigma-70 family)
MTPRRLIEPARLAGTALLHTQSDERLVDLTRAGNGRAFEAIVTRYRKQLLRYCAGILPPERAEDAVQQAFLNAYKAIAHGEAELKLRPWLYRIAHNSALNLLRQNGWNYDQIPEDFDGVMQPPQAVEQSERIRQVVRNVQELPGRQRDAIVLRELEGRSYEEIARALGVSDGAVRQLLNRARTTLRAAATAITPPQLVERVAERAAMDAPAATRIAEISVAGAGGAMTLAKFGTVVVVAGAVAGGMTGGPLDRSGGSRGGGDVAAAAEAAVSGAGLGDSGSSSGGGPGSQGGPTGLGTRNGRGRGSAVGHAMELADRGDGRHGGRHAESGDDHGGRSGDDNLLAGDDRGGSGHGGDEHSGSGTDGGGDGSGGDHSGPGGGDDGAASGSGSSGGGDDGASSGSGSSGGGDDGGSSGSGGGDDGLSGSGTSGSGTSGSGTSGSGTSGSVPSGSGSDDLGPTTSSGPGPGLPDD